MKQTTWKILAIKQSMLEKIKLLKNCDQVKEEIQANFLHIDCIIQTKELPICVVTTISLLYVISAATTQSWEHA